MKVGEKVDWTGAKGVGSLCGEGGLGLGRDGQFVCQWGWKPL
jgi:hypothetical protein